MDFEAFFKASWSLHEEGRYRVFADLERQRGTLRATRYTENGQQDVTVWCSNDYLGMGQNADVIEAMKAAIDNCGAVPAAPATFPAPTTTTCCSSASLPICTARNRR